MFQLSLFEAEEEKANTALQKMIATVAAKDKVIAAMLDCASLSVGVLVQSISMAGQEHAMSWL